MLILLPLLVVVAVAFVAGGLYVYRTYYARPATHKRLLPRPLATTAVGVAGVLTVVLAILIALNAAGGGSKDKSNQLLGGSGGVTQQP